MTTFIKDIVLTELLDKEGLDHILDLDLDGVLRYTVILFFELLRLSMTIFIKGILPSELLDKGLDHVLDLDLDGVLRCNFVL